MKLGDRVRLLEDLFGIESGLLGTIVEDYTTGFMIKWDDRNYKDGFNKETELHMLEVING